MKSEFWKDKNVLVTGATGMVGSHVVEKLISSGANVIALARSRDPRSYFFSKQLENMATLAYGDLKDFRRIADIVGRYEIEYILHLGAQPIVTTAYANPLETFKTNIDGTAHVLEAARLAKCVKGIVVASSDKAYGKSEELPYVEEMPLKGDAPYEVSKSCADLISLTYAKTYSLPVTVARFGNIYGPGDLNFSRIIPGAIRAALKNETLEIRSDGKMIREYLYVEDVANGYLALAENIQKTKGEAFNFGSLERLNVLEVVKIVERAAKKKIRINILNTAKNEIPKQYLSSGKVRKAIGWKTEFEIEKGIGMTIPWYDKILR